jgi:5'-phosphate synthase pdxT subunit
LSIDSIVPKARIGILALQGDFQEHAALLSKMGCATVNEVRLPKDLDYIDGLIIPGGESTTMSKLIENYDFRSSLIQFHGENKPIWGTCAGTIIIAKEAEGLDPWKPLDLIDISVQRNGYGRQLDSFQANLTIDKLKPQTPFAGIFIRAPKILSIGEKVETLSILGNNEPVAVKQKNVVATTFHPELTGDFRFHQLFLELVSDNLSAQVKET